jgi:hypothetical protein
LVSIARGGRAQLFVRGKLACLPYTCPASKRGSRVRLLIDAIPQFSERHKTVSTERAQQTEIPLLRVKEQLRFGSTGANFSPGSVRCAARGNMISTLRGKATNFVSRGSRAESISGLRHFLRQDLTLCLKSLPLVSYTRIDIFGGRFYVRNERRHPL